MEFRVSVLLRPEIEGDGGHLIDDGISQAVLCHVDRLEIGVAGIAAFDANVRECLGGINGKLGMIFLAAVGTDEAAELPFRETYPAEQATAAAVALRAKDGKHRLAMAKGTQPRRGVLDRQWNLGTPEFGVRLEKGKDKELLGIGGGVDLRPALGEEVEPQVCSRVA